MAHNNIFITNANYEKEEAGGLFVSYDKVSNAQATVNLKAHIRNVSGSNNRMTVCFSLKTPQGEVVKEVEKRLAIMNGKAKYVTAAMVVDSPFCGLLNLLICII